MAGFKDEGIELKKKSAIDNPSTTSHIILYGNDANELVVKTTTGEEVLVTKTLLAAISGQLSSEIGAISGVGGNGGGSATTFLELLDTPSTYSGSNNYLLSVNGSEIGFIPQSSVTPSISGYVLTTTVADISANLQTQITTNSNDIQTLISDLSGANNFVTTIGDGINDSFLVNHNLNNDYVDVNVYETISKDIVHPFVSMSGSNNVYVSFNTIPTADQYVVSVESNNNSYGSGSSIRNTVFGTTSTLGAGISGSLDIEGYKTYALMSIDTSHASWVRVYSDDQSRINDIGRSELTDPLPNTGVIAEVITTGNETVTFTPAIIGFNIDSPITNNIPISITNKDVSSQAITVTLTLIRLE